MSKQLIICEKPSLANNVCSALSMRNEQFKKCDGASVSDNYVVIPAFGHLFRLKNPEEYKNYEHMKKWKLEDLPFIPNNFEFITKGDKGVSEQFEYIKKWVNDESVYGIINCGDSDREGEIIVRIILNMANNTKPIKRLWLPDQVESSILAGIDTVKDSEFYDNLANEGYARMCIDWIYGINLTRYATMKNGKVLHIGRVIGGIIKAIYDRDKDITEFTPKKYVVIHSKEETNGEILPLMCKEKYSIQESDSAEDKALRLNIHKGVVKDIVSKKKSVVAPKLFSQSTLQNALSKRFAYPPDKTLMLVQNLYERGYVSYPRTPTEYMATAEKDKIIGIIEAIKGNIGASIVFKDNKRIFDDSKIESHSAITPTLKIAEVGTFIDEDEENCYRAIYNRFCAVFCEEDCEVDETTMSIMVDSDEFNIKGLVEITKGWRVFEPTEKSRTNNLPCLSIGDSVNINFKTDVRETKPPKLYTVETLNNYLKNPFKNKDVNNTDNDDEEYNNLLLGLEIGTEATRSGIIANAIARQYITLNKTEYSILPRGKHLVDSCIQLHINIGSEKTAHMGMELKNVYKGNNTIKDVLKSVESEIREVISYNADLGEREGEYKVLGECPMCGGNIYQGKKTYYCSNWNTKECVFKIWKIISGKSISEDNVIELLSKGTTGIISGFVAKSGKKYSAKLSIEDNGNVGFLFDKKK